MPLFNLETEYIMDFCDQHLQLDLHFLDFLPVCFVRLLILVMAAAHSVQFIGEMRLDPGRCNRRGLQILTICLFLCF